MRLSTLVMTRLSGAEAYVTLCIIGDLQREHRDAGSRESMRWTR